MIDITGVDLRQFVKEVYRLSSPQGRGVFRFQDGPLDDETVDRIIANEDRHIAVSMDYVRGRACKMTVFKENDGLAINDSWFDHSDSQLRELLVSVVPQRTTNR